MTALLGIDCATQPEKVGLALGELRDGIVHLLDCTTGSRQESPVAIVAGWLANREQAIIALDAPLGWPKALGACLHTHEAGVLMHAPSNDLFRRVQLSVKASMLVYSDRLDYDNRHLLDS